jgi:serine/threonine protein kinase
MTRSLFAAGAARDEVTKMARLDAGDFHGNDRFLVEGQLGEGGYGVVYRAFDRERNTPVALKTLRHVAAKALVRFKQEFRALADVSHPNLVSLYELSSHEDQWFFTMELVDGVNFLWYVRGDTYPDEHSPTSALSSPSSPELSGSLRQAGDETGAAMIHSAGALNLDRLRRTLPQLTAGVVALHEAGKLHRDIKPSNVLVTLEGRVVLLDFGLVTEIAPEQTHTLDRVGTPAYMSPEQMAGLPLTEASDWYNVGSMLYQALTGRLPFSGSILEVMRRKQESEPAPPRTLVPEVAGDLDGLCGDLLHRDPEKRPSGPEVLRRLKGATVLSRAAAVQRAGRVPFVGRHQHLEALRDAFRTMKGGRAVTVAVHGGSGMGKSALVRRFLDELKEQEGDAVILSGRCYERESVPYKALDSLLDALSRYLRRLPSAQAEALLPHDILALARVFPVLRQVNAVNGVRRAVREIPDSQELRRRAFSALRELLVRLADRRPLVLFIDDLQWGDLDSAALLEALLRPPDSPALLLIGCYRSEEADTSPLLRTVLAMRDSVGQSLEKRDIVLAELPPAEARELATSLLGIDSPPALARTEAIVREAGGNPFFIGELARHSEVGSEQDPSAGGEGGEATLQEVIRARASRLPKEARRLLEVVAVAGRPLELAAAARAAGLEGQEQMALAPLRAGHWVRTRVTPDGEEIEAYHDRIRDLVAPLLLPEALSELHRRLALSLSTSAHADPERLAVHFQEAGDHDIAAKYAALAAAQAGEALAFDRAARLFRLALELQPSEAAERQPLRVALGEALAKAGRGADAARAYLAAAPTASPGERVELQRRAAEQFLIAGHIDEGFATIRVVLAQVGMSLAPTPRWALLRLLWRRAQVRLRGLRFRERDAAQVPGQNLMRIDTCWSVAVGLSPVDTIQGAYFQARHLLLALEAGEPYRVARALALEAGYLATAGGHARRYVKRVVQAATALAERVDVPHALGLVSLTAGIAAFLQGEWKKARVLTERAESILRERCTGVAWELGTCHLWSLTALLELGELAELSRLVHGLVVEARERGDLWTATSLRTRVQYVALLANDQPDAARRDLQQAIEQWSREGFHLQHLWYLFAQVGVDLYLGKAADAWGRITNHWPILRQRMLMRIQSTRIQSLYLRARSALAMAACRPGDRVFLAAAERDAVRLKRERMAWGDPLAALLLAGVADGRGETASATALLVSAEDGFTAADMGLHAACVRRRRGELLGGEAGRGLVARADAWMTGQNIRNPERMAAMLAPGR